MLLSFFKLHKTSTPIWLSVRRKVTTMKAAVVLLLLISVIYQVASEDAEQDLKPEEEFRARHLHELVDTVLDALFAKKKPTQQPRYIVVDRPSPVAVAQSFVQAGPPVLPFNYH